MEVRLTSNGAEVRDSKQIYFGQSGAPDNDVYDKGSCVLHALRWLVGDEAFFEALRRMAYPDPALERVTDGSQVRFADSEDFVAIAERAAGAELGWFFETYLRRARLPQLHAQRAGDTLALRWEAEGEQVFPLPVPLRVGAPDSGIRRVPMPDGRARIELPPGADYEVDPEGWLLRE